MRVTGGVNFDPAADEYDAARPVPEDALAEAVDALARATGIRDGSVVYEGCVGTGRIGGPLAARTGCRLVGVDVAARMLSRARERGLRRVLRGDAARLPLRAGTCEVALFVHALHVVPDWRGALAEAARVLEPSGRIVVDSGRVGGLSPLGALRDEFQRLARETGFAEPFVVGAHPADAERHLDLLGWRRERVEGARWTNPIRPRDLLRDIEVNAFGFAWVPPPELKRRLLPVLTEFARARWGDLDRPIGEEAAIVWDVYAPPVTSP